MRMKEQVLLLLENHREEYLSGQQIAERLSITRAGVWKAVKALQKEGYGIEAVNNRGYILRKAPDVLSAAFIRQALEAKGIFLTVQVEKQVDSTNNVLKQYAADGEKRDLVLLAEEQSAGKGRRGRSFYSPEGTGLYMSLLLHPDASPGEAAMLTTLTAAAAAKAVEKVSGEAVQIKWVNDVWMRGKKISGILTEGSASLEEGKLEYAVVGIGINIYEPPGGFPEEVREVAGAVFTSHIPRENLRNSLAAEFIVNFMEYYSAFPARNYLEEYRKRSFVIGKRIRIISPQGGGDRPLEKNRPDEEHVSNRELAPGGRHTSDRELAPGGKHASNRELAPGGRHTSDRELTPGGRYTSDRELAAKLSAPDREHALALGIDDECHLKVQYEDGTTEYLSSGEISIRPEE